METGARIGRYELLAKLGAGGMGEVFRAHDPVLERDVAIKLLTPELAANEIARQRLLREARAAARLEHPNVCTIYEAGVEGDAVYLVLQFLSGETVAQRLAAAAIGIDEILHIASGVAAALAEAHRLGMVHRDIKPQNVMITPRGVKVLDFGLARLETNAESNMEITRAGEICGTTVYMSPEQLQLEPLDGRSDVFSFGVMLHELVTRQRPFDRASIAATIAAILHEPAPPVPEGTPRATALARLIERMLSKRAAQRPSADEVLRELQTIVSTTSGDAPPTVVLDASKVQAVAARPSSQVTSSILQDPEQQKRYVRARHLLAKRTIPHVREALDIFQQIVDGDPDCAAAYAGVADCYLLLGFLQAAAPQATFPRARAAAQKAIDLEPSRADAHAALGYVEYLHGWDVAAAERELRTAIALDERFATAHHWLGLVLAVTGRFDEARSELALASSIDPLAPIFSTALAFPSMYEGKVNDALRIYNDIVEVEPSFVPVLHYRGLALERAGHVEEAIASFDKANSLAPVKIESYPSAIHALAACGRETEARERLALLRDDASARYVPPLFFAIAHLGLREEEEVWRALDAAFQQRGVRLGELHYDRRFDVLEDRERFADLVRRIGVARAMNP